MEWCKDLNLLPIIQYINIWLINITGIYYKFQYTQYMYIKEWIFLVLIQKFKWLKIKYLNL